MEIELRVPYAEIYKMGMEEKTLSGRKLYEYVRSLLEGLHPGFCSESLWDYKVIKSREKKYIISAVLDRDFYIEKKLTEKGAVFVAEYEKGRKTRLFQGFKFDEKGKRRKIRYVYISIALLMTAVLFLILLGFCKMKLEKRPVMQDAVKDVEEIWLPDVFGIMNRSAGIIGRNGGKITHVSYTAAQTGIVIFSVTGCEPYALVSDITKECRDLSCSCKSIVYGSSGAAFELKVETEFPSVIPGSKTETELLELQSFMSESLCEADGRLLTSVMEEESLRVTFLLECKKEGLRTINGCINRMCIERKLFLTDFSEEGPGEKDRFAVSFGVIPLDEKQNIEAEDTKESLSELFEVGKEKSVYKASVKAIDGQDVLRKEEHPLGYTKIGSVKKEGKSLYYYRTEEGKIVVTEAEYE